MKTFTKSPAAKNTWTAANGSIRVTAQTTKRHGKAATLYTATINAGTPAWKDVGEAHTLAALESILSAQGLV